MKENDTFQLNVNKYRDSISFHIILLVQGKFKLQLNVARK